MLPSSRSWSQGPHSLALLRRAQDAQRHHQLAFTFRAANTSDLRRGLAMLVRVGIVGHVAARRCPEGLRRGHREITCSLRYWEGRPLVSVITTPMRLCSYHDLKRRTQLGCGSVILLWSGGKLKTSRDCLAARAGGLIVAVLSD